MAESTIGRYKTELIRRRGAWRTMGDVEIATLEYIDWFNNRRMHAELGDIPPLEYEADHYRHNPAPTTVAPQNRASTEVWAVQYDRHLRCTTSAGTAPQA